MLSLAVVAGAMLQGLGSAAPPRAPARGGIKLSSCPQGGSSPPRRTTTARRGSRHLLETTKSARPTETAARARASRRERPRRRFPQEGPSERRRCDEVVAPALQKLRGGRRVRLRDYKRRGDGRARSEQVPGGWGARAPRHRADIGSDVQYKNYRSDGTILMLAAPTKDGVDVLDAASAELAPTPGTTSSRDQGRRRRRRSGPELPWADFLVPLPGTRFGGSAAQQLGDGSGLALVRRRLPAYLGGTPPAWRRRLRSAAAAAAATTTPSPKP